MLEIKTLGDPIIDYFDTKPTYGQLGDSQEKIFSTMAHMEIQIYMTEKYYGTFDAELWLEWLRNFMPTQNIELRGGITNWANNRIWISFGCYDCSAKC